MGAVNCRNCHCKKEENEQSELNFEGVNKNNNNGNVITINPNFTPYFKNGKKVLSGEEEIHEEEKNKKDLSKTDDISNTQITQKDIISDDRIKIDINEDFTLRNKENNINEKDNESRDSEPIGKIDLDDDKDLKEQFENINNENNIVIKSERNDNNKLNNNDSLNNDKNVKNDELNLNIENNNIIVNFNENILNNNNDNKNDNILNNNNNENTKNNFVDTNNNDNKNENEKENNEETNFIIINNDQAKIINQNNINEKEKEKDNKKEEDKNIENKAKENKENINEENKIRKEQNIVIQNSKKNSKNSKKTSNTNNIQLQNTENFIIENSIVNHIPNYEIGKINFGIETHEKEILNDEEQKLFEEAQKNLEQFYPPEQKEVKIIEKKLKKISLKEILSQEKLVQIIQDDNTIIYHGELKKLINYEISVTKPQMYSARFCIMNSKVFKYYKSKEQFLKNLKPLCIVPLTQITKINFAKIKKTSKKIDHIILCNKLGIKKHEKDSIFGHMFDDVEARSYLQSPETDESLLIFTCDNEEFMYRWYVLLQYFTEKSKLKNENSEE